jgi:hypothetical protein
MIWPGKYPIQGGAGMPNWDDILTARDKAVFSKSGYGKRAGFGQRPAVLVIDVNYNFVGDKPDQSLIQSNVFVTAAVPKVGKAFIGLASYLPNVERSIYRLSILPATMIEPTRLPSAVGRLRIVVQSKI